MPTKCFLLCKHAFMASTTKSVDLLPFATPTTGQIVGFGVLKVEGLTLSYFVSFLV